MRTLKLHFASIIVNSVNYQAVFENREFPFARGSTFAVGGTETERNLRHLDRILLLFSVKETNAVTDCFTYDIDFVDFLFSQN